jgi:cellobiose phosphorylase
VKRKFRGATYNIEVKNSGVNKGVKAITVDGKAVEGCIIPDMKDGKEHNVIVELGK